MKPRMAFADDGLARCISLPAAVHGYFIVTVRLDGRERDFEIERAVEGFEERAESPPCLRLNGVALGDEFPDGPLNPLAVRLHRAGEESASRRRRLWKKERRGLGGGRSTVTFPPSA